MEIDIRTIVSRIIWILIYRLFDRVIIIRIISVNYLCEFY